jgi:hypothetical protein
VRDPQPKISVGSRHDCPAKLVQEAVHLECAAGRKSNEGTEPCVWAFRNKAAYRNFSGMLNFGDIAVLEPWQNASSWCSGYAGQERSSLATVPRTV